MTRFARAKGSKSSNERVPESATSWNVMKLDLQKSQEEAKNKPQRQIFQAQRQKNYDEFVKETESKIVKKWAEFPKPNLKLKKKNKNLNKITEKDVTDDMINEMCHPDPEVDGQLKNMTKKIEEALVQSRGNKNPKKKQILTDKPTANDDKEDDAPEETTTKVVPKKILVKKAKNNKPSVKIASVAKATDEKQTSTKKHNKKMNQNKNKQGENKFNKNINPKNGKNQQSRLGENKLGNKFNKNENQFGQKRKLPKERDNLEHKRRKPFTEDISIRINGEIQDIILYQGFPVLKSDHDRLVELRKSFVSKGIPRSEVNKTMKLERRKAEKHLAKMKKVVCFQCRESGHMLSECPQLGNGKSLVDNAATGICFKCGSTEHTYKECKVSKEFSFAKCFICREQGHISNQCPDNPRGLYPKGGACLLCGDVTHLKKDCPKRVEEQKNNAVFLNTISDGNIESIDEEVKIKPVKKNTSIKKKVVLF